MDDKVEQVCKRLRVFIQIFGVVRDEALHHGGDGAIEAFSLAAYLPMVCRCELVPHAQDPATVLVQLARKLRSDV